MATEVVRRVDVGGAEVKSVRVASRRVRSTRPVTGIVASVVNAVVAGADGATVYERHRQVIYSGLAITSNRIAIITAISIGFH